MIRVGVRIREAFLRHYALVAEITLWAAALWFAAAGFWYVGLPYVVSALFIRWWAWRLRQRLQPECVGATHRALCSCGKLAVEAHESRPARIVAPADGTNTYGHAAPAPKEAP